uniref:Ovule protein n=1 Tax=Elaeophora elaphi TaxID=1147741 RepID=A0A0R3RTH7_9BILA
MDDVSIDAHLHSPPIKLIHTLPIFGEMTSLISPVMETSKLSGIDEEQQCLMRADTHNFQCHLQHQMIHVEAAEVDGNGNTPLSSVTTVEKQTSASVDSLPGIELHSLSTCGMTYSSTSDSGCMIESGSSIATIDDEQTE